MKRKIYYRYSYGNTGIFVAAAKWGKKLKGKLPEFRNDGWLKRKKLKKGCKSFFTKEGDKKYKKTFLLSHKAVLNPKRIKKTKIICSRKINKETTIYDSKGKRLGRVVYEDKYQIVLRS